MPDYRRPYEQVCQDYTRYLIENTGYLELLASSPSELDGQPSWVTDFRNMTYEPDLRESFNHHKLRNAGTDVTHSFSSDGTTLIVEGVCIASLPMFFSGRYTEQTDWEGPMLQFRDAILTTAAEIRQQPLDDVWRSWCAEILEYFTYPKDAADQFPTIAHVLDAIRTNQDDLSLREKDLHLMLQCVLGWQRMCAYALANDGSITCCRLPKRRKPYTDCELWGIKGASEPLVLQREGDGGYRRLAHSLKRGTRLEGEFFPKHESVRIRMV